MLGHCKEYIGKDSKQVGITLRILASVTGSLGDTRTKAQYLERALGSEETL